MSSIISLDLSSLVGYLGSPSAQLAAARAAAAGNQTVAGQAAAASASGSSSTKVDVTTPWDATSTTTATGQLVKAMQTTNYVDITDSTFDKPGVPDDYKKLFAIYNGLSTLSTLATAAANKDAQPGTLPGLNQRFQTGFAQITQFASSQTFDDLTLVTGQKQTTAQTSIAIARPPLNFVSKPVVQGDVTTAMPALANAGPFTINVTKGSAKTAVNIDLSEMGDTTKNLGNVVNFINSKLAAAGVSSRLQRTDVTPTVADGDPAPAKQYAVTIVDYGAETLNFQPAASSTALYLGNEGTNAGELRKLSVDGTTVSTVYKDPVSEDGSDVNVKQTAKDAQGNVFVLGTATGDEAASLNQSTQDVMLRKYDSAGNLLWSKLMGATDAADGLGLAVDSKGNAVVAGQITGALGTTPSIGGTDSYVMKIGSDGEAIFANQIGSIGNDSATAVTVGPDDSIYIGGTTNGKMQGAAGTIGGSDAYVAKYDSTGKRLFTRQFGTTGNDTVSALAIAQDGSLVVGSSQNGQGVVQKFSTADGTSAATWTQTLGDLQSGGKISGLAVDGNSIYVAGASANGSLTGGGASVVTAASGGMDGFVYKMTDNGSSDSANYVTYLGSNASDKINGIAVANGQVYVAGDTTGVLPGAAATTTSSTSNAFAAGLNADGTLSWARQFGVTTGTGFGRSITADATGASALDALGLPKGTVSTGMAKTITAQTTTRAGDYFTVQVNDLSSHRITIDPGETMTSLSRKINSAIGLNGKAEVVRTSAGETLKITPASGQAITLGRGDDNLDALAGLGLSAGHYVATSTDDSSSSSSSTTDTATTKTYALGLKTNYDLSSTDDASAALTAIQAAMASIRSAYSDLTNPAPATTSSSTTANPGKTGGPVPAWLSSQIANYQAGLQRLTAGQSSSSSSLL